jgi:isopentenyl diphosphate isomerase/L-lactate dehydrogenase-like FMN-dependent dehydrogenase
MEHTIVLWGEKVAVPFNEDIAFISKTTLTAFKDKGVTPVYTATHQCFNHRGSSCHAVIVKNPAIIFVRFNDFGIMSFQHTCLSELLNRTSDSRQVTQQIL